jgi:hypothetical protein
VDFILTVRKKNGETEGHVIVRNVLILAVDSPPGGRSVELATFALDPGQDDQLMEALSEGKLSVRCSHAEGK